MEPLPGHLCSDVSHCRIPPHRLWGGRHHVADLSSTDLASGCRVRFNVVGSLRRVDGDDGTLKRLPLKEIIGSDDSHQLVLIEHRRRLNFVRQKGCDGLVCRLVRRQLDLGKDRHTLDDGSLRMSGRGSANKHTLLRAEGGNRSMKNRRHHQKESDAISLSNHLVADWKGSREGPPRMYREEKPN